MRVETVWRAQQVRCSRDKSAGRGPGYAVARWAAVLGRQSGFAHKAEKLPLYLGMRLKRRSRSLLVPIHNRLEMLS